MTTQNKFAAIIKGSIALSVLALSVFAANSVMAEKGKNMNNKSVICHIDDNGEQTIIVNSNNVSQHMQHGDYVGECGAVSTPPPVDPEDMGMPF